MSGTLRSRLSYEPRELKFGTSGRRGLLADLTHLEVYITATAELEFLKLLPRAEGGVAAGEEFYFACDLRPSSREIAQTVVRAIEDAGLMPVNLGRIPTPALTHYAIARRRGSIMITGSHIPFDRNGYKLNTSAGELLKIHEEPVNRTVAGVRARIYGQPFADSLFNESGQFQSGRRELPPESEAGRAAYIDRYTSFFGESSLRGMKLLVYQHSAVGRDILVEILRRLGAEAIPAGRSEIFVPIDTENIDQAQLATIQQLVDGAGMVDAVVSTDGDSDRPLILGIEAGKAKFFSGDLAGMIVAEYLGADAVVVPISCNDAVDRGDLAGVLEPKTRIGSPYVIAGMEIAFRKGRRAVCGWEANGGFLTGSDMERNGRKLAALPTRDAMLPLLAVLCAAAEKSLSLPQLFARLPARFSKAALLKNFPREMSLKIMERFSSREELSKFFAGIRDLDYTDGLRITLDNGEVAHIRPSGNADELRFYAVADTQERADAMAAWGVAEPNGLLRQLAGTGVGRR
jgi:phosphomannomutase